MFMKKDKPIGSEPGSSPDEGQDPKNKGADIERQEKASQDIPRSMEEYANPGKATLRREAEEKEQQKKGHMDDEDKFDINSLRGELPN
jgi:hypothetical protein